MKRTCSVDARGQTATGRQEVNLAASRRSLQSSTMHQRAHAYTFFFALFTNVVLHISIQPPTCLKVLPEVRAWGRERGRDRRRKERCNRIITQDTSLKGTAVGGPIWALYQQAHTHLHSSNQRVTVVPNYGWQRWMYFISVNFMSILTQCVRAHNML